MVNNSNPNLNKIATAGVLRKENSAYFIQTSDAKIWLDLSNVSEIPKEKTIVSFIGCVEAYSYDVKVKVLSISEVNGL